MKKVVEFKLKVELSDELNNEPEKTHISESILRAIENEVNHGLGLTSDNCDKFTKSVSICEVGKKETNKLTFFN